MNQLLQQIKSVPGVSGVLIFDKKCSSTFQLLPASFAVEQIRNLAYRLKEIVTAWPDLVSLEAKFAAGYGQVYNSGSCVVFILTRVDIYFPDLNLVLKSVLPQIEKKISRKDPFASVEPGQTYATNRVNMDLLIMALNTVANKYREHLGAFQITKNLRRSKEKILHLFAYLSNFYVDNQGRVAFMKVQPEINQSQVQEAFASWLYHFKSYCDTNTNALAEVDIKDLTGELQAELARQGFYHWYETVSVG